jgi:hypothetical protein
VTVSAQTTFNSYTANGVSTVFPYQFKILAAADLQVYVAGSIKTLNIDYSVSGVGIDVGGSVTFLLGAPAAAAAVSIIRAMTVKRTTDYQQLGDFLTPVVNPDFDNPILLIQDLQTQLGRSIRMPADEVGTLPVLPSIALRSGKYITFDSSGQPVASAGTGNDTALRTDLANGTAGPGSLLVAIKRTPAEIAAGVVPVNYPVDPGNVLRYGTNTTPGTTDMTTAIQAALNQRAQGGASVYVPAGTYLQTSALSYPLSLTPLNMYGDGQFASVITTALNIENLTNAGADATHGLPDPVIHDLSFYNTFPVTAGAGSTSFNVHLKNPLNARIYNVYCKSNFADTDFNANNHAGIWLDRIGGYGAAFQNLITGCWIQNGQILMGTSDSAVTECICWGHPCDYAIKLDSTNIAVQNCYDLTGSRNHGAVWLTVNATLCRVQGNFFDGAQGAVNSGYGVWGDAQLSNSIENNTFWTMTKAAIWLVDPQLWNVSGNVFQNCGSQSLSTDDSDVVLNATSIATNNNVCNNTHLRTDVRAVSAYAIFEKNSGAAPQVNRYIGNQIADSTGQYLASAINLAAGLYNQQSLMLGNAGKSVATEFSGQYTGTLTGCATAPTATLNYTRQGNMMEVYCPALAAVSNTTACTITGMPAAIRPTNTARGFAFVTTNGVATFGAWAVDNTGVITLYVANSSTGFAAVGNKGVIDGLTLIYPLN